MYGQIRSLPRTIDGEKSQLDHVYFIEMMVNMSQYFAASFCRGIRRHRPVHMVVFGKRNLLITAVNTGRRSADKLTYIKLAAKLPNIHSAADIYFFIIQRPFYGRSYAGQCGQGV